MACDFMNVLSGTSCAENFSGVGMTLYIFNAKDLAADPDYSEDLAGFTPESFAFKEGKGAYRVILKRQSGKVTSTSTPNGGGFVNTFTGVVASNMDKMSLLARTLNNNPEWGAMVGCGQDKDGKAQYYVIYDPTFGISFNMESDTGDTPESDHGHTITISAGPMIYPMAKWTATNPLRIVEEESAGGGGNTNGGDDDETTTT